MTTGNRDLSGWMCPYDVVSLGKSSVNAGKGYTAIEPAFPHGGMHQSSRIVALQTDLDFLATPFFARIDDQRTNVISNIKHDMFGVYSVNSALDHLFSPPLFRRLCRTCSRYAAQAGIVPVPRTWKPGSLLLFSWERRSHHMAYPGRGSSTGRA